MSAYDVIIIGTGAGGGTLARHLAPSGKSILILERGGWLPREPSNWSAQEVFVDNRYVSEETWYDETGKTFQPGVHYWVGGATKLYGAALYRLRKEDFGELKHPTASRPRGRSRTRRWSRTTRRPSSSTKSTARAARIQPSRRQRTVRVPGGLARAAHPAATRRSSGGGLSSVPCPVRRHAQRGEPPFSACIRCGDCDGFPCFVHAKADAEVMGVRPALQHPNVTLLTDARSSS